MTNLNLKYFNLTENETNVYTFLLKNSPQTVVELNKKLKISRTGLYKILEKLINVKLIQKKNKVYYSQEPKILYNKLKKEEKVIQNQKRIVKYLIEISKRPKIKAFHGPKGYKELNNELRKDPVKKGYIIVNSDFMPKSLESRRSKELFTDDIVINFTNKKKKKGKREKNNYHINIKLPFPLFQFLAIK